MQQKHFNFIKLLFDRTKTGKLVWDKTDTPATFQTTVSDYSIQIFTRYVGSNNEEDVVVNIFNENGELIERIDDTDVAEYLEDAFKYMMSLYDMARGNAMGIDSALTNIIDRLQSL